MTVKISRMTGRFSWLAILLIALTTAAQEVVPRSAADYITRGSARIEAGAYDAAIADFDQAIVLDPKNALVTTIAASLTGARVSMTVR